MNIELNFFTKNSFKFFKKCIRGFGCHLGAVVGKPLMNRI